MIPGVRSTQETYVDSCCCTLLALGLRLCPRSRYAANFLCCPQSSTLTRSYPATLATAFDNASLQALLPGLFPCPQLSMRPNSAFSSPFLSGW